MSALLGSYLFELTRAALELDDAERFRQSSTLRTCTLNAHVTYRRELQFRYCPQCGHPLGSAGEYAAPQ